jgi:hypothetical protein
MSRRLLAARSRNITTDLKTSWIISNRSLIKVAKSASKRYFLPRVPYFMFFRLIHIKLHLIALIVTVHGPEKKVKVWLGAAINFSKSPTPATSLQIFWDRGRLARRCPQGAIYPTIQYGCSGDRYRLECHNFWPYSARTAATLAHRHGPVNDYLTSTFYLLLIVHGYSPVNGYYPVNIFIYTNV